MGDLGGVLEVVVAILGVVVLPISKYSFELKVLENMFIAHTRQPSLFKTDDLKRKGAKMQITEEAKELRGLKMGEKVCDNFGYYRIRMFNFRKLQIKWTALTDPFRRRKKDPANPSDLLHYMYTEGLIRIEKEFSIEKIA